MGCMRCNKTLCSTGLQVYEKSDLSTLSDSESCLWQSMRLHAAVQVSHERRNRVAALVASAGVDAAGDDTAQAPAEPGIASDAQVALLTALPFGLAAAWMLLLARHSQATGAPCVQFMNFCRPQPRPIPARAWPSHPA